MCISAAASAWRRRSPRRRGSRFTWKTRTIDYPFAFIELHLNADGEGDGKMSLATKIIADKENDIVTLENYDTQPVMLTHVRREKSSR